MKWIYLILHSPISQGVCFVLPLVASHGHCQHWYPVQCYHPQILQVAFVMKTAVGRTAKRMLLIVSFDLFGLFESKSTEKNLQ